MCFDLNSMCSTKECVMTYSYPTPLNYGSNQVPLHYEGMQYKEPSSLPATVTGAILGAGFGGYLGSRKTPYFTKNNEVVDSFAKNALEKYMNTSSASNKDVYKGNVEILKKIESIKSPEELKSLFDSNKEAAEDFCRKFNQSVDDYIKNITKDNLSANKKSIKENLTANNNTLYQNMKNNIQSCWNKDKKKFVKPNGMNDDLFNSIKKATNGMKTKGILKSAGIGALISGATAFAVSKFINYRNRISQ